jgi:hypothetical protein
MRRRIGLRRRVPAGAHGADQAVPSNAHERVDHLGRSTIGRQLGTAQDADPGENFEPGAATKDGANTLDAYD